MQKKKDFDMIVFCTRQLKPYRFARLLVCLCKRLRFSLTNATLSCITLLGKIIHILERQTATKLFLTLHMFMSLSYAIWGLTLLVQCIYLKYTCWNWSQLLPRPCNDVLCSSVDLHMLCCVAACVDGEYLFNF